MQLSISITLCDFGLDLLVHLSQAKLIMEVASDTYERFRLDTVRSVLVTMTFYNSLTKSISLAEQLFKS